MHVLSVGEIGSGRWYVRRILDYRDLRALAAVVDDGHADDPGPAMPWAVMQGLIALIPCEELGFCEQDVRTRGRPIGQAVFEDGGQEFESGDTYDPAPHEAWWRLSHGFRCSAEPDYPGQWMQWSEQYTPRELRRQPLVAELWGPMGVKHFVSVALPSRPGRPRRRLFWRNSGRDFDERDKLPMKLLWPHLENIYWEAERRRQGIPRLTRGNDRFSNSWRRGTATPTSPA